ncbi:hypothetical protein NDU88_006924 [Pleurodeles waltl]|uniref:Uncharacterized protein n=1 Tax=Pleurodeles waltl TaxID=8319 RepID=A0AAV7RQ67_PLEWA|nr:hypothetical protein NDU88_006924 [Pleurodeles waltl]
MASRTGGALIWRLNGKGAAGSVNYLIEEAAVGGVGRITRCGEAHNFKTKPLGARSRSLSCTTICSPAQRFPEQRRLREDSAGPVRAERLLAGQQAAPAHTTGLRQRVLTSFQWRLSPSAGSGERGSQSAGLGGPRGRHRPRRCTFFFPSLRNWSVMNGADLSDGAALWGPTNGLLALLQGGLGA